MASSQATTKPINSLGNNTGNKRASLLDRGHDLYETPPEAVRALLKVEDVPQRVWEPACGPGAIVKVLRESGRTVFATDIADYGCPDSWPNLDFLKWHIKPDGIECILTNPPFRWAGEFVSKSIEMAPKVYMLLRLAFIESARRAPILDGGKLAKVYAFSNRLPMMHRDTRGGGIAPDRQNSSAMAFAWFVWDRHWDGKPTELRRISWEK